MNKKAMVIGVLLAGLVGIAGYGLYAWGMTRGMGMGAAMARSEEHTSELQSPC